jgi:hypothetical protein
MTDGDDKLKKAYRELGTEEPGPALDQSILAAAHRAVAPRRATQRWAVPVSLAAVLVLAVGVTLRMQQESPGIEVAPPNDYRVPPSRSEPAPAPPVVAPQPPATSPAPVKPSESKPTAAPALKKSAPAEEKALAADRNAATPAAPQPTPPPLQQPKAFADSVPGPPATVAPPPPDRLETQAAPAPAARAQSIAPSMKMEAARPAAGASPQPAAPAAPAPTAQAREKRDASDSSKETREAAKDPLERELDRIARLRREGRNTEADEALEKFRRDNPGYRIPDAVWEQVKPR